MTGWTSTSSPFPGSLRCTLLRWLSFLVVRIPPPASRWRSPSTNGWKPSPLTTASGIGLNDARLNVLAEIRRQFPHWASKLGDDHLLDLAVLGEVSDTSLT